MAIDPIPTACTIAGSDSSAGAGIQADLKVFSAYGVYGLTVITATTAQNTRRVAGSWIQSGDSVAAQITTLCEEFTIGAWKTGMLGNPEVIDAVIDSLPDGASLILDPVIVSTSGHRLLSADALTLLIDGLIPLATVVTPNIPEAEMITGITPILTPEDVREAAAVIRSLGADAVIIKGGHGTDTEATDILLDSEGEVALSSPRYPYEVHGSGCSFASAIAAEIALGADLRSAFPDAKRFIDGAIRHAIRFDSGGAVPDPFWEMRRIEID
ncbi:phosphomethylpyrimidine kinase [Methanocalculus chunghsingensis]|uniref:Phosphomethylpyrimidine kinase n=1 Tax=Methanocalculus chunghsingensis TaxID=156457 RepID=A0A8J8B4J9_9EURY|nr:bifunctional hydroxymethylpyrimidine kinase/phosphomethylpyrimidine kinase [Methanocalculus chunghsingensis]MBR1369400.1 phosphomethylpyrimidine kinase [Methanocalculus chunghsingensis]